MRDTWVGTGISLPDGAEAAGEEDGGAAVCGWEANRQGRGYLKSVGGFLHIFGSRLLAVIPLFTHGSLQWIAINSCDPNWGAMCKLPDQRHGARRGHTGASDAQLSLHRAYQARWRLILCRDDDPSCCLWPYLLPA